MCKVIEIIGQQKTTVGLERDTVSTVGCFYITRFVGFSIIADVDFVCMDRQ